jgi:outer membrane protein assembly factor BamB
MPIATRRRKAALWVGAVALLLVVGAGIVGWGFTRGWFDPGSVEGTSQGFDPGDAPAADARSHSWPEYGFDARRTRANPRLALAPPFDTAWTFDAGSLVEFPPVIADGRAVVGTNAGLAIALDVATGKEQWRVPLRGRVASSPALSGELALFTTIRGDLIALRAATGAEVWRRKIGSPVESSPLVVDDTVFIGTLGQRVMRLDARTGGVLWNVPAGGQVKASLAVAGPNVVVGDYAGRVTAFRRTDGKVVWDTASPGGALRGSGRFYGGPAVAYGRVFIGNINGRVLALDRDNGQPRDRRAPGVRGELRPPPLRPRRGHRRREVELRRGREDLRIGLRRRGRGLRLDAGQGPVQGAHLRTGRRQR